MSRFRFRRVLELILVLASAAAAVDDMKCLQGFKKSLDDPSSNLRSWDFTDTTPGAICNFIGVTCWSDQQNRVINLELKSLNLGGNISDSLQYCSGLQNLDLSGNRFSGPIPSQICTWLPFLVTLDLSNNNFTGPIPADLDKCAYLNNIMLNGNSLSGNLPPELSSVSWLQRVKTFDVANNQLSGTIPAALSSQSKSNFEGNSGLCGWPLGKCGGLSKKSLAIIIAAGVSGAAASMLLVFGAWLYYTKAGKR